MRIWQVKGYVTTPGLPQTRFTTQVNAQDRTSATALVKAMYAGGPNQTVNISSMTDMGKSPLKSN